MEASGVKRILARLIDIIIECVIYMPLYFYLFLYKELVSSIVIMLFASGIFIICEFLIPVLTKGRTIGKAILSLRIISEDYGDASVGQLFLRSTIYIFYPLFSDILILGRVVSYIIDIICIISLVFIFADDDNQAVYDKISRTIVIES